MIAVPQWRILLLPRPAIPFSVAGGHLAADLGPGSA